MTEIDLSLRFKHKHTGEVLSVIHIDFAKNYPEPITVYVLSDGSRWNTEQLYENWTLLPATNREAQP